MSAQCLEMLLVCMLLLNSMNSEHINKSDAETLELLAEAAHKVWMSALLVPPLAGCANTIEWLQKGRGLI